jgi:type 1 glutamine amidotransferase
MRQTYVILVLSFFTLTYCTSPAAVETETEVAAASQANEQEPSLEGKNVLFVYGGWEGHEPVQCMEFFQPWLESEGANVTVSDTLGIYTDSTFMESLDLIIQLWTMGKIERPQLEGLIKAVRNGAGYAGWHGGIGDSFREATEYQFMVGGQWVSHPGGIIDYEVNIVDHDDPVTAGLEDFDMTSEQYYMHVDPNVKVLATTTFNADHVYWIDECVMPVMWKKYYGEGRIFYTSLGHQLDHLLTPNAMETVKRGIRWASESKYHPKETWVQPIYANKK